MPIMGTSPEAIDLAEDRDRFAARARRAGHRLPGRSAMASRASRRPAPLADEIGYPAARAPQLRARRPGHGHRLRRRGARALRGRGDRRFPRTTRCTWTSSWKAPWRCDLDALCDGEEVYVGGILEHIEMAGIHSGDSACCTAALLAVAKRCRTELRARRAAAGAAPWAWRGLVNIQFAVKDGVVYVIEANPRASRTVPFVSKATGVPLAKLREPASWPGEKLADAEASRAFRRSRRSTTSA